MTYRQIFGPECEKMVEETIGRISVTREEIQRPLSNDKITINLILDKPYPIEASPDISRITAGVTSFISDCSLYKDDYKYTGSDAKNHTERVVNDKRTPDTLEEEKGHSGTDILMLDMMETKEINESNQDDEKYSEEAESDTSFIVEKAN